MVKSKLHCTLGLEMQYVTVGLHTYIRLKDAMDETLGLHSVKYVVVKCIIPKGSSYYTGTFGDTSSRASNRLIPIKVINPENYENA